MKGQGNYTQNKGLAKCAGNRDNFIKEWKKQAVRWIPGGLPVNCACPGDNSAQGYKKQHLELSDNFCIQDRQGSPGSGHRLGRGQLYIQLEG